MQILNKILAMLSNNQKNNKRVGLDDTLLFSGICLLAIGIVMVYSSSIAYANNNSTVNSYYFLFHHLMFIFFSLIVSYIVYKINTDFWFKSAIIITIIMIATLIAVLIPHIGRVVNGSRRWIGFMGISFQPSEFTKVIVPIIVSYYLVKKKKT